MKNTIILDVKRELQSEDCKNKKDNMIVFLQNQGYKTNNYLKLVNGYYKWHIDFEK